MGKSIFLLFVLLVSNTFIFCQVKKDSLAESYIYPPNSYEGLTPKESWYIHKAAYLKQLKTKGLTDEELKQSLIDYEKQKEEFLARVKEQHKIAEIQRKKAKEKRTLAAIERKKAEEQREKDAIQRKKADELRKQAETQRVKAEEQRKKSQEWRENAENILIKNITLSNQSNGSESIIFKVTHKTTLYIGIRAHIISGTALIEIYNPKGVKEGELSLNSKSGLNESKKELEYTSGALDKTISNAEIGKWQIKISSQKSNGNIAMSVSQSIKPTVDE